MKFKAAQKKAVANFDNPEFIENIKDEDPNMVNHLGILKQINECGFLTTNSQAGIKTIKPLFHERAYILGFMVKNDAAQFMKNMSIETDKVVICPSFEICVDKAFDIPLSMEKKDEWKVFTHMSTSLPRRIWDKERKKLDLDKKDIVYIFCWDPKWNRNASNKNGLFTDVLKILKI
jgi:hypothetical protein